MKKKCVTQISDKLDQPFVKLKLLSYSKSLSLLNVNDNVYTRTHKITLRTHTYVISAINHKFYPYLEIKVSMLVKNVVSTCDFISL